MRIHSHDDPEIKSTLEKISKYTKQAETMGMAYWVIMENQNPIGILTIGKEPIQLIELPGTIMSVIQLIDVKQPYNLLTSNNRRKR